MPRLTAHDARDVILVAAGCVAAAIVAPELPLVGVPLAAMGLAWLAHRYGVAHSVGVALLATVVSAIVSGSLVTAILTGPVLLVAGPLTVRALRTRSALTMVSVVTLVTYAGTLGMLEVDQLLRRSSIFALMRQESEQAAQLTRSLLAQSGSTGAGSAQDQVNAVQAAVLRSWPSVYLLLSALVGLAAVGTVVWVLRRLGSGVNVLPPLEKLDLSWHWVWPVAAGLGALASAKFLGGPTSLVSTVGENLMIVARWVLFAQGVAVFAGLYRKAGIGRVGRTLGYLVLVFTELVTPPALPVGLVSLTGLVDLFANIRKLPRGGSAQPTDSLEGTGGSE